MYESSSFFKSSMFSFGGSFSSSDSGGVTVAPSDAFVRSVFSPDAPVSIGGIFSFVSVFFSPDFCAELGFCVVCVD